MQHGRRLRELGRRHFLLEVEKKQMEKVSQNESSKTILEDIKTALEEVEKHLKGEIQLQNAQDFLAELDECSE